MRLTHDEDIIYIKVLTEVRQRRNSKNPSSFSIPDLFSEEEWSIIPDTSRMKIGKLFKKKVDINEMPNVVYIGQNEKDWATYKLIF